MSTKNKSVANNDTISRVFQSEEVNNQKYWKKKRKLPKSKKGIKKNQSEDGRYIIR